MTMKSESEDKKNLFILKGFSEEQTSGVNSESHLLNFIKYDNFFEMLNEIEKLKGNLSILTKIIHFVEDKQLSFVWITYEEYVALNKNEMGSFFNYFDKKIVNNNLYYNEYPVTIPIPDIANIYKYGFLDDDDALTDDQEKILEKITSIYGKIDFNSSTKKYYVTYENMSEDISTIDFYGTNVLLSEVSSISDELENVFSLNDSEDQILSLIYKVLNNKVNGNVYVLFDVDDNYHQYKKRISILNNLNDNIQIKLSKRIQQRKELKHEKDYLKILKEYWNFEKFRDLKMYENPKENKKTTDVSQAQIIDDIVEQSEIGLANRQPRDIFITASTGAGKSVMFQLPAFYLSEKYPDENPLTIVIQPLIGLMNDQVKNLKEKGVKSVETVNSNIDPIKKAEIIDKVQNGQTNILFISTETLQNKSDIKMLIGDRKIGLFIVDEAHTVTTWGKTFRADYWYMGLYLTKLRKQYKFPIVTFTATAIYGGPDDMYRETVDSLNLIEPIKYIGYTKRNDIFMVIDHKGKKGPNEYLMTKQKDLLMRLKNFVKKNKKTLVYFPTVKSLNSAFNFLESNDSRLAALTRKYYGPMNPADKDITFKDFKSGKALVVLATKAFGMGIDIPDIDNVYHYSPTGDVVDYVQEIGRAARAKDIKGFAGMLFLDNDMNSIKQLHGMSAVRKFQIVDVMKKIVSLYKANHYNRNLVISADDFKYVLQLSDYDDLDNKIKIILLMIEKDFEQSHLGYAPFVARPKPVFGNELVFLNNDSSNESLSTSTYGKYLNQKYEFSGNGYKAVYDFDLEGVWKDKFQKKNISYPYFKKMVFDNDETLNSGFRKFIKNNLTFATGIDIDFNKSFADVREDYRQILRIYRNFARKYSVEQRLFKAEDLAVFLRAELKTSNNINISASSLFGISSALINASLQITKTKCFEAKKGKQTGYYSIKNSYIQIFDAFDDSLRRIFEGTLRGFSNDSIHIYYRRDMDRRSSQSKLSEDIAVLGIGESFDDLTYEIKNGNNPEIYLRINSIQSLQKAISNPERYHNELLSEVQRKYYRNVAFLTYLFTHEVEGKGSEKVRNYTKWFWDRIEDYFLGKIPEEVLKELDK